MNSWIGGQVPDLQLEAALEEEVSNPTLQGPFPGLNEFDLFGDDAFKFIEEQIREMLGWIADQ